MKIVAEFDTLTELLDFAELINTKRKTSDSLKEFIKEPVVLHQPKIVVEDTPIPPVNVVVGDTRPPMLKLPPLNSNTTEVEKLLRVWFKKFNSREVEAFQILALAKEQLILKGSGIYHAQRVHAARALGKILSPYVGFREDQQYFIVKNTVPYKTPQKTPSLKTTYHLVENEKFGEEPTFPKKLNLSSNSSSRIYGVLPKVPLGIPADWTTQLEQRLNQGGEFGVDAITGTTGTAPQRMQFLHYLRQHPELQWHEPGNRFRVKEGVRS